MNVPTQPIYHAALPQDWAAAQASGSYEMSTIGVTLAEEGFIHCSTRQQVEGVANRYYGNVDEIMLLTLDRETIGSPIVDEPPAPQASELYPHVYGPIPVAAVVATTRWSADSDGVWHFPL